MTSTLRPPRQTLNIPQAKNVLRYWLECVRLEEALSMRPLAYRGRPGPPAPINMKEPVFTQKYFKIPLQHHHELFAQKKGELVLEFSSELGRYFESWLHTQYRHAGSVEQGRAHLALLPVLLTPRGELASLLRMPLLINFRSGETRITPPTYHQRRRGLFPASPDNAILQMNDDTDGLPYFLDTRVLQDELGIDAEQTDTLFDALRSKGEDITPETMLQTLTHFVQHVDNDDGIDESKDNHNNTGQRSPAECHPNEGHAKNAENTHRSDTKDATQPLNTLIKAIQHRLTLVGSRTRVFPHAVIISAQQVQATWHLQKELQQVLTDSNELLGPKNSALSNYIRATPPRLKHLPVQALCLRPTLTKQQEEVAELSLGSSLISVQGPPGTGKTSTIQHLCAHHIAHRVSGLKTGNRMGRSIMLVTSTNNRAVDNALEPFIQLDTHEGRLPLALRTGNRRVNHTVLLEQLQRARDWLRNSDPPQNAEFDETLSAHNTLLQDLSTLRTSMQPQSAQTNGFENNTPKNSEEYERSATDRSQTTAVPQYAEAIETLRREIFQSALRLRELCALRAQVDYIEALDTAIEMLTEERPLRLLFNEEKEAGIALRELFPVWGCTLLSLGNIFPAEARQIDYLVIDEAGQCHPAYAVSGIMRARKVMIIGDVHQLEPVIDLGANDEQRLARTHLSTTDDSEHYRVYAGSHSSVQALSDEVMPRRLVLRDHFRSQPDIIRISDTLCGYGLNVRTSPASQQSRVPLLKAPLLFADCSGEQQRFLGSWFNAAEVQWTVGLIDMLLSCGIHPNEIALITPYRGQCEMLRRALSERSISAETTEHVLSAAHNTENIFEPQGGIALGTIHRFQGGERSIVIFSTVARRWQSRAFLEKNPNLLNVAVSRAKEHLIVVGDAHFLRAGPLTQHLVSGTPIDF